MKREGFDKHKIEAQITMNIDVNHLRAGIQSR